MIEEEFQSWKSINESEISIYKGVEKTPNVSLEKVNINVYPINKNDVGDINISISSINELIAPVQENTVIGTLDVKIGDETIISIDILISQEVRKKTVTDYFKQLIYGYRGYLEASFE